MDAAMDMKDLDSIKALLMAMPGVLLVEENLCRTKEHDTPDDPHFRGKSAWGQRHADHWAIKRVGMGGAADSAWAKLGTDPDRTHDGQGKGVDVRVERGGA